MLRIKSYQLYGGVFALLLVQTLVFGAVSLLASGLWEQSGSAAGGRLPAIQVAGLSLEGRTWAEARADVERKLDDLSRAPLLLTLDQRTYPLDKGKLGLRYELDQTMERIKERAERSAGIAGIVNRLTGDEGEARIPLSVVYDRHELKKQIADIAREVEQEARAATLQIKQERAVVVPERIGYQVDVEETIAAVETELETLRFSLQTPLKVKKEVPTIVSKDLEQSTELLSQWRAQLAASVPVRLENVKRAAELINGTILLPNQVLSFNELTGPYTAAKGYRPSADKKQEAIPDGLGGSAVQVASALYETAVMSGLEIIERHSAKRPVDVQKLGMEAFVNGEEFDLRFANRLGRPVYIHAAVEQGSLRVALYGPASPAAEKPLLTTEISEYYTPDTIVRADSALPTNAERIERVGEKGFRVKVYLYYPQADKKVPVADNVYLPIPHVIAVGPERAGAAARERRPVADWPTEAEEEWLGTSGLYTPADRLPDNGKPPDINPIPLQPAAPPVADSPAPASSAATGSPSAPGGTSAGSAGGSKGTVEKNNGMIILHDAPVR